MLKVKDFKCSNCGTIRLDVCYKEGEEIKCECGEKMVPMASATRGRPIVK